MEYKNITFEWKENIAYVGFGKYETKSMTTISQDTLKELDAAVEEVGKKKDAKGLILFSHKPGVFLAGMEITVISSLNTVELAQTGAAAGQTLFNKIEDLKVPTMALVDGVCLGGGLEMSLACDQIIASDNPKTKLGLPEVMLGILPGFGGTYRLPKKIGLPNALDLILTGKQVDARKAKKLGLVEKVMPAERLLALAPKYLGQKKEEHKGFVGQLTELASDNFIARKIIFQKARESVLKETKGFYPAPLKILDVLEEGAGKSRSTHLALESKAFGILSQSVESQSLQHVFFLTDASKKGSKDAKDLKVVKKGAVLGAGTMGGGIAWLFAQNNQAPIMKDIGKPGLELGFKQASSNFMRDFKRKKMTEDELHRKLRSIVASTNYDGFKRVDLVVEAVVENMDVKKKVFQELEKQVSADCLITSNTSSLSVTEMASVLEHPERFAGLHFFNPVNKMPLVEIVRHPKVSEKTIQALVKWVVDSKKTPVVVNDGPGFLVNRILMPFLNEATYLLEEGVSIEDLDKAALNFGMPMGPCRLMDEIGIDVIEKVAKIMGEGLGARAVPASLGKKIVEAGLYGKKNSKGFYLYDAAGKQGEINEAVLALLPNKDAKYDEKTIQMRLVLPMINEASNILLDKITDSAASVDLGLIYGIGFPPFRGGLLRYADREGLDKIADSINKFAQTANKDRFALSPYLKDLVANKKKFYEV